jgi:hypothetical protein
VLDTDDYIIQSDEVVHEVTLGRRISGSCPTLPAKSRALQQVGSDLM